MNLETITENILIVDDQLLNLRVLTSMLTRKNYQVRKATDGETAIEAVKIEPPDLIILDIKMPEMDGYQVCECLKSDAETKDIPVIFISALTDVFDKVKAFKVGGIDYITKPFAEAEVLARIENQLIIQKQQKLLKQKHNLLDKKHRILQQEIKNRKQIEVCLSQSRKLLSSILNSSLDGIAALEAVRNYQTKKIEDFRCLEINSIIAEVFNKQREDLIGNLVVKNIINKIDVNLFPDFVKVVETGISLEKDFSYEHQGEEKWYSYIAVKLADGFSITIRDITARKKLELELHNLANLDGLTGISNRRIFDKTLAKEWQICQREKQPLTLILIDIDYFKKYNDDYGHQQGDDCLICVADALAQVVKRPRDMVARYGGEEFVLILPNTQHEGAIAISEQIQQRIRELAITHESSEVSAIVSLSLGIASVIPATESSPQELINMADQALYQAKKQGRDRAVIY
ncbi:MAG: diguanylate cyclase [Trichodesmium sp.]